MQHVCSFVDTWFPGMKLEESERASFLSAHHQKLTVWISFQILLEGAKLVFFFPLVGIVAKENEVLSLIEYSQLLISHLVEGLLTGWPYIVRG